VRVNIVDDKRQHTRFLFRCADDPHTFNRRNSLGGVTQQLRFVRRCLLAADGIQIIDRRAQSDL
jgi:hypothetical protein